ncbi:hypothetical protein GCM10009795_005010 [Nocardioides hankookensis]|uniref:Nuclear transport factor 2 family protein n=1 Tax=Nocardioides hankookensis TaxID=443157 RepID=A0ABW1LMV3_9ACTN
MTRSLGVKAWATGTVVLAALTGCASSGSSADPSPPATTAASSPTTTSSSPSPTSASEVASTAAEDVVRRYFAVLDGLRHDPTKALAQLSSVATSTQLAAQKRLLTTERSQKLRQVGDTKVVDVTVQSVNLDNSDPSAGKVPTATVDVCWDVSDVDIVDKGGKSVVSPNRASAGATRYTVANYHWSDDPSAGWRIATGQDLKHTTCVS